MHGRGVDVRVVDGEVDVGRAARPAREGAVRARRRRGERRAAAAAQEREAGGAGTHSGRRRALRGERLVVRLEDARTD